MLRITLAALLFSSPALAQAVYDFNALMGSDVHPYTQLDGQDNWSETTFNAANRCGVTATLSHDSTQALRFQEVGPGYGCDASRINDINWSYPTFTGRETNAYFQADMIVGYWGGSFGLAHDTSGDGTIRGAQAGERGVRFTIGTQTNVQIQLNAADGTGTRVPLANLGISGGNWVRIRVVMDLFGANSTGLGSVAFQNMTTGMTDWTWVPGLQNVPLGLTPGATDATNPVLWDAVWLHFEGATYGLDNIEVGLDSAWGFPYGTGCGATALELRTSQRPLVGATAELATDNVPIGSTAGLLVLGSFPIDPGFDLSSLGMTGCSLYVLPQTNLTFGPTSPTTLHTFPIPPSPFFSGASAYAQSVVLAPGSTPFGVITSNGMRWVFGTN
ncbi:MAG: hypothetical protein H6833_07795 [Planctomycetes bacterium]|nr:hypothetical protein [Planctomycetota bacterium]